MSSAISEVQNENSVLDSWQNVDAKQAAFAVGEALEIAVEESWCFESRPLYVYPAVKRIMDILGALVGIVISSPALLIAAVAIWLEDRGPVFFVQTRVGKDGKTFPCLKLRTMVPNADALKQKLLKENVHGDNRTFKHANDPRITRTGRWLRKLSIDEFPQFFNVLLGHMSIVGPRPAVTSEVELYSSTDRIRLRVKPGLTCLWQISGRSTLPFEEQVRLDAQYIKEMSFTKDVEIIVKTIPAMLSCEGAR